MCAGFILGVVFGSWGGLVLIALLICGVAGAYRNTSLRRDASAFIVLVPILISGFLFGYWRLQDAQPGANSVVHAVGKDREVTGTVLRVQEGNMAKRYTLSGIAVDGAAYEDRVLVSAHVFSRAKPGEIIRVYCEVKKPAPFEDFAYDRFLAAKDILATCKTRDEPEVLGRDGHLGATILGFVGGIHDGAVKAIDRILPEPHAQLLAGLLIGDDAFSDAWSERFLTTGTSHIVAASGSNVAIVVSLALSGLFALGVHRRKATWIAIAGIFLFVLLAGFEAAVTRAGIMASLIVLARMIGRKTTMRNVILLTVTGMLLLEPRILRDDVGFQLSVLSTIGLLLWAKPFGEFFKFIPEKIGLREAFVTTCAATFATLPVTLLSMGQLSLVGPLVNLLVLPMLSYAMLTGAIAAVIGAVHAGIGSILAFPAWLLLDAMLFVIREVSRVPYAKIEVDFLVRVGIFLVIAAVIVGIWHAVFRAKRNEDRVEPEISSRSIAIGATALVILLMLWHSTLARTWTADEVAVWVFNIGQGDAILIDTPERDVVIDGGPTPAVIEKVGVVLPWFDTTLDVIVNTHPHADHLIGLVPLMQRYEIGQVLDSGQGYTSPEYFIWDEVAKSRTATVRGDVIELTEGVKLETLWPRESYMGERVSDPNDGSVVMLLETPNGSMLLTGDAGVAEEAEILDEIGDQKVAVLKVGHHGSRTSTSAALLERIGPDYAVISAGEGNDYGHPHEEALDLLAQFGVITYRTDLQGDVRVLFSPRGVEIEGFDL